MNCPHCGHAHTRVRDVKRVLEGLRRYRLCKKCGQPFATVERVEIWDSTTGAYAVVDAGCHTSPAPVVITTPKPEPVAAEAPAEAPAAGRMTRFMPTVEDLPDAISIDAAPLLLSWWCEARRSKHQGRATWTRAAWQASADRVAQLSDAQQLALCQAGIEHGWQALKPEYLDRPGAGPATTPAPAVVAAGRLMPKDPAMLAALDTWPETA